MKKIFLAIILLGSLTSVAKAESKKEASGKEVNKISVCSLKGLIADNRNFEAIAGACITVDGKKYYSDFSGKFDIPALKEGKYKLLVDFISYQTQTVEVDLKENQEVTIEMRQQ